MTEKIKVECQRCGNPDAFSGEPCWLQNDPNDKDSRCRWINFDLPTLVFTLDITFDISDLSKEQKKSLDDLYFPELQAGSDYDFQSSLMNPTDIESMLRESETGNWPVECAEYRNKEHVHISYDFDGDDDDELYVMVCIENYWICFPDDQLEWYPKDFAQEVLDNSSIELKLKDRIFKPITVYFS